MCVCVLIIMLGVISNIVPQRDNPKVGWIGGHLFLAMKSQQFDLVTLETCNNKNDK